MESKDYHKTIMVHASPKEAIKKINQIIWWKKEFKGNACKLNDKFTIPFGEHSGESSYVDFVLHELDEHKKVVWKVLDCHLPWFQDKKEWNNTEVVFELSDQNGKTSIDFTHVGLVPEVECYTACEAGWNGHIHDLEKFIDRK